MTYGPSLPLKIAGAVVIVLAVALILSLGMCRDSRQEARLRTEQGEAATDSGKDAVATLGASQGKERAIDDMTAANDKEIRNAKGADAAVDPAVRDAGIRSVCRRPSAANDPKCLPRAAPR